MREFSNLMRVYVSSLESKMKSICAPLKTHFGLDSFCYTRVNDDDSFFQITTHAEQSQQYFYSQLYLHNPFMHHPSSYEAGTYLLRDISIDKYQIMLDECNRFGLEFYLRIVEKKQRATHQYVFGSSIKDLPFHKIYAKHKSLLSSFTSYFLKEVKPHLVKTDKYLVSLPSLMGDQYQKPNPKLNQTDLDLKLKFLKDIGKACPKLTFQERNCAQLLSLGMTCIEIADELHLSKRTVEHYAANLKDKLDCSSKSKLVKLLSEWKEFEII